jgi:hypothetical protein
LRGRRQPPPGVRANDKGQSAVQASARKRRKAVPAPPPPGQSPPVFPSGDPPVFAWGDPDAGWDRGVWSTVPPTGGAVGAFNTYAFNEIPLNGTKPRPQSLLPLGIPGDMPISPGGGTTEIATRQEQPPQPPSVLNADVHEPERLFGFGEAGDRAPFGQGPFAEAGDRSSYMRRYWTDPPYAPLTIVPTVYPAPPGDTVTVEDPVSINLGSAEFREFKETIGRLCTAIEQSNQTSREVADKLVAELQAGLKIIEGPKPSRKLLGLLLVGPLLTAAGMFAPGFVGELAKHAADLLLKLIGAG